MGAVLRKTFWFVFVISACSTSSGTDVPAPTSTQLAATSTDPTPTSTATTSTSNPPPTTSASDTPELPAGVTIARMVAFVEEARGRTFARTPEITFVTETPLSEFSLELGDLDWAYLQLLGIATNEDRAPFAEFLESQFEDGPFGKCCPIWVKVASDPVQTAAIIVHELVHLIDKTPPSGGPFEWETAIIEGNAVRIEAAFLETIGIEITDVRREDDELPPGVPKSVVDITEFGYDEGFRFASSIAAELGEAGIDVALASRDMSSEHVLFPETYLAGQEIVEVKAPIVPDGASLIRFGSIGAFVLKLAAEPALGTAAASDVVRQWAGDAYVMYRDGSEVCLRASVVLDSNEAAVALGEVMTGALSSAEVEVEAETMLLARCIPG